jgi:hypothetical protein
MQVLQVSKNPAIAPHPPSTARIPTTFVIVYPHASSTVPPQLQ